MHAFGEGQTINEKRFREVIEDHSSDMLVGLFSLLHTNIPCAAHFFNMREVYYNKKEMMSQDSHSNFKKVASPRHLSPLRDQV